DLNKAVTLLRKTIDISETMHASKSVDDVLDLLLGTATDVFGAQRVSIMIRDPKNDEMAIQLAQGMNRAMVKHVRIRANEGIAGQVIATGKPVIVNDTAKDSRFNSPSNAERGYTSRSFMSVPI